MLTKYKDFITQTNLNNVHRTLVQQNSSSIDFSSNDYLNLSKNSKVIEAGHAAALAHGAGSTGSRLLSGNLCIFEAFEKQIAIDKKTDSAMIFNSGFQANSSALAALLDKNSVVVFDKLNHASLYQGAFLSKAKLVRYNHLDYAQLEDILKENIGAKHIVIVSETVFGMDGDAADVDILSFLADKYSTFLYLDEAHATGLYGSHGYGICDGGKFNKDTTIIMGTFSKAVGCFGAYIACNQTLKDFFIQKCGGFVYSTALSPFCIGSSEASWSMIKNMAPEREKIMHCANFIRKNLKDKNKSLAGEKTAMPTNIVSVLFSSIEEMQKKHQELCENNIITSGIRRPTCTVPRIRIALNVTHTDEDVTKLLNLL